MLDIRPGMQHLLGEPPSSVPLADLGLSSHALAPELPTDRTFLQCDGSRVRGCLLSAVGAKLLVVPTAAVTCEVGDSCMST